MKTSKSHYVEKIGTGPQAKYIYDNHDVHLQLKHNGKEIEHKFTNVRAKGQQDAIDKVSKMLKEKLPRAVVQKIRAKRSEVTQ